MCLCVMVRVMCSVGTLLLDCTRPLSVRGTVQDRRVGPQLLCVLLCTYDGLHARGCVQVRDCTCEAADRGMGPWHRGRVVEPGLRKVLILLQEKLDNVREGWLPKAS